MDDHLFKKLEELEYRIVQLENRIVQLENQNRGLVWEEVEEMPENSKFLVDLQTGDLIPKEDDKLFEMME